MAEGHLIPDKPTLTLVEGRGIGVAQIAQLYKALTGKTMTEDERSYAEDALARAPLPLTPPADPSAVECP